MEGGIQAETQQTLENLDALLKAAGTSLERVLRCSVSLRSMADFQAMNEVYAKFWPQNPPARVAVEVTGLAGTASVEIQCDAALPHSGREVVKVPGFPDLSKKFPLSFATKSSGTVYLSGSQGMDLKTGKLVSDDVGKNGELPSRVCTEVGALAGAAKVEIQCTALASEVERKIVKVPGWPDMPGFPFSSATEGVAVAYISGNQGVDMKTSKLVSGGAGPETTQTLVDIKAAVEAAGSTLAEVLKCEVSLSDLKDFAEMNKAYAAFWQEEPPARVAVQVGALARGAAVEIRCLAALPQKSELVVV